MSAARAGEWSLLGHASDPVPADAKGLDAVIKHYRDIAAAMTTQAALLKRIGDGDESQFKGEAANAMRKRARESADALGKAADRYVNVKDALVGYQPALETARSETATALSEAERASRAQRTAEGLPDPVNTDRPDDAPPLTDAEREQSQGRTTAIGRAAGDLEAARARAGRAVEALASAAESAARLIRKNWDIDGLKHSGWEAFKHKFNKFLKGLVEILGWIGMALAIIAMIIPGLGVLAWVALGVAVVGLLGTVVLAAQGEESWLAVVWGIVGVVAAVGGIFAAKAITAALKGARSVGQSAVTVQLDDLGNLAQRLAVFRNNINGPFSGFAFNRVLSGGFRMNQSVRNITALQGLLARLNPGSWTILRNPGQFWSAYGVIGLGGLRELGGINAAIKGLSVFGTTLPTVKPWVYVLGSGSWFVGLTSGAWSTGVPGSSFSDDDARHNWTGRSDYEYNHLTTGAGEPI